jgi:hypothetical protein
MKATAFHIVLVGVTLCVTPTLLAQSMNSPQFKGMGSPPPGIYGQSSIILIYAMSESGEVLGTTMGTAVSWTPNSGYSTVPPLIPNGYGEIDCVTEDSSIYFGAASDSPANERAVPVKWHSLTLPPTTVPGFPAGWACFTTVKCNADGTVVAGLMKNLTTSKHAIYFYRSGIRKNGGWEFIDKFPPGFVYAGFGDLSADGTIGVGAGPDATLEGFQGIRWTKKDGLQVVPDLPGGITDCSFIACDATGFRASNWASPAEEMWIAGLWEPVNGWALIGKMKASHTGASLRIDDSGFAGAGTSGFHISNDRTAFLWNVRDGMRSVEDVLVKDYGLTEVVPWQLRDVDAISPDGRFMAGRGLNPQGKVECWWAEIKPFCYADCDNATSPKGKNAGPPVLDIDDFICFQTKFAVGDYLYADCDLNGYLEIDDFICFQTAYALGC